MVCEGFVCTDLKWLRVIKVIHGNTIRVLEGIIGLIFLLNPTELDLLYRHAAFRTLERLEVKFQGLLLLNYLAYCIVGIAMMQAV